jgi:hypothetical protein
VDTAAAPVDTGFGETLSASPWTVTLAPIEAWGEHHTTLALR